MWRVHSGQNLSGTSTDSRTRYIKRFIGGTEETLPAFLFDWIPAYAGMTRKPCHLFTAGGVSGTMRTVSNNPQKFLEVALEAVEKAGPIFRASFGHPPVVYTKGGSIDVVTDADREIEKLLVTEIKKHFPDHDIVGEEFSPDVKPTASYHWYVDPIDGTRMFVHGLPTCCISVGVCDREGPLAGVVCNPETRELFTAIRGKGAFKNGKPIVVSKAATLLSSFGGLGWTNNKESGEFFGKLVPAIGKVRALGSSAYQLCLVAEGRMDFFIVSGVHSWDVAAGVLIAKEAGATLTNFEGKPYDISSQRLLATNGTLHTEFVAVIQKSGV